jgi:adenosylcobinamide-GDP ribazoletransferase
MPASSALRAGAAAVTFLTRIPFGRDLALGAADVRRGALLFPLVGAAIGAVVGFASLGLDAALPALLAAALAVALEALVTGGIHLDALADTADALGAETRERALELMRESTIGAFGAVALVLDLVVKTAALAALLEGDDAVLLVTAAWAAGRTAPLALAWALPYARPEGGSGTVLTEAGAARLGAGVALGVAAAVAAAWSRSPALLAAAAIAALGIAVVARTRFGGATGDVLGAAAETTTTVALVGAVAAG